MGFWEIVFGNLILYTESLLVCALILAWGPGKKPRPKRGGIPCMALVTLGISALHSLFGAVCYTQGWAGSWIAVFVSFFSTALTTAFCFCVIYRESMKTCWILASAFSLLGDFSSNLAALCMISNGPYNLAVWKERVVYLIMMHVITPLIEVIFVLLLQKLGILRVFWDWLTQKEFRLVSVLAFSLYPVWEYGIFTFLHVNQSQWGEAYSVCILVSVCFVALFVIGRQKELQRKQIAVQRVMIQQQNAYIESLEGLQREVRRFRHDYKNMMAGMYAQAKEGDADAVRQLIWEVTDDFESQVGGWIQEMTQLGNVHMMEVKGLLLAKAEEMKKERIEFDLEVFRPFVKTAMKRTDLCRCLGILLDNAMDEVRGKERAKVSLMISSQEGVTTFRVKNALYSNVDFQKIWQHGYSTRGSGRGIGLASYKKILEHYDNAFSLTTVSDGYFVQELKIQE